MSVLLPSNLLGNVLVDETSFTLSTGAYDRAASSLGLFTTGDREFLKPYGTEGSAATISNLDTGTYSFDWSMYSKDKNGWDKLYAWNGKELSLIGDCEASRRHRSTGNQISTARWTHDPQFATVDVIYDFVTFIAIDENSKTGTTEFTINNFDYLEELPYDAPMPIELAPTTYMGDVDLKDGYTSIGTGSGDRAMSTLSLELTGDRNSLDLGTEGSYAKWEVENGTYEVTYKVYSSEDNSDRDTIYYWEDGVMEVFAERSQAEQTSKTRYQTDWMTSSVEVTDGQLMFMAVDEVDQVGSTQLRIKEIEKVASEVVEPEIQTMSFDPTPEDGMGAIEGSTLSTGAGAVSADTLTSDFFHNMVNISQYGTEGTAALWVTEPGIQQITWSVSSTVNDPESDQFLLWDGQELSKLGDLSVATYSEDSDIYQSDRITSTVNVVSDEWGILALDTGDTQGDSLITIHDIKWLSDGEVEQLPEPDRELLGSDPDNEPIITWQQQGVEKVGTYYDNVSGGMVLDGSDRFEVPLGYNEGVEGIISISSGSDLTLDIYDKNEDLYSSYSVGSSPVGFSFGGDTFTMEVTPSNADVLTEYSLSLNLGQVYDPY